MTWRRRLLVATATLGGGIICFQPVMRARLESRLSEIVGGRVEIGSSKISIKDGAISLRDIIVHPAAPTQTGQGETSPTTLRIQHAALKFSWKGLLYRNLTVENLVASDVRWELVEPSSERIPTASAIAPLPHAPQFEPSTHVDSEVASLVQPLMVKIADVAAKQSRAHLSVSSRIKSVLERLSEFTHSNESLNVLRPGTVLDEAQKELAMLQQTIAEDRLARKDSDKAIDSLHQAAQKSLADSLEIAPEVVPIMAKVSAIQFAKAAVATEWTRNRPLVYAALNSISSLQPSIEPLADKSAIDNGEVGNGEVRTKGTELLAKLPVGLTRCVSGKAVGVVHFPGLTIDSPKAISPFEIRFRNLGSAAVSGVEIPQVTIKMIRDANQDDTAWLLCNAYYADPAQSDAKQVHFVIERIRDNNSKSTTTIQHANQGWAATVSLPIDDCFEASRLAPGLDIGRLGSNAMVSGKLIGTTQSSTVESERMLIDIDDASVAAIEAILLPMLRSEAEKKKSQAFIRRTELLNSELLQIASRRDQLGDEHSRAHAHWELSIQELNEQIKKVEKAFARTARNSSPSKR